MTELKTLKEIKSVGTVMGIAHYYEDIRQSAIRDIKALQMPYAKIDNEGFIITNLNETPTEIIIKNAKIDYVKWKFNITKKELK